jgi:cytochrome b subunit of formate dehydrogenase
LEHGPDDVEIAADDEVQRFDGHVRAQHAMMIISFVTLALTGWPLKSAEVGVSSDLARVLGGQATLALLHRCAGVLLIILSVYHLVYLFKRWRSGKLSTEMIPGPEDLGGISGNVLYFLGLQDERPKFGKYTYYEKFDYWAIFWGVPLMVGTGLILWFPEICSKLLPGGLITLAFIAHSDEALLAVLAIFLWHFYNQHLRPSVFPMSWVWITGRITGEALYDEHRLTYEKEYGEAPPRKPVHESAWHEHPFWSVGALVVVLLASVIVLVLDVESLSEEMAKLGIREAPERLEVEFTHEVPEIVGVYDEGFDGWETCFVCHNETRYESDEETFPHVVHFEDEELDDDCLTCHESVFHLKFVTDKEECLDCHEPEEIGLPEQDPEA